MPAQILGLRSRRLENRRVIRGALSRAGTPMIECIRWRIVRFHRVCFSASQPSVTMQTQDSTSTQSRLVADQSVRTCRSHTFRRPNISPKSSCRCFQGRVASHHPDKADGSPSGDSSNIRSSCVCYRATGVPLPAVLRGFSRDTSKVPWAYWLLSRPPVALSNKLSLVPQHIHDIPSTLTCMLGHFDR